MRVLTFCILVTAIFTTKAAGNDTLLCRQAAATAEKTTHIPSGLLQAIALVESGTAQDGERTAWPWTLNVDGKSHYFPNRRKAQRFLKRQLQSGVTSIDIGCFQINAKWHGGAFADLNDLFDPVKSALYAASFLTKLQQEAGDWSLAARRYHSRTEALGEHYGKKIEAARMALASQTDSQETAKKLPALLISNRDQPPPLRNPDIAATGGVSLLIFDAAKPVISPASTPLLREGN